MIVFSEIKRCQLPHSTQFLQEAKSVRKPTATLVRTAVCASFHRRAAPCLDGSFGYRNIYHDFVYGVAVVGAPLTSLIHLYWVSSPVAISDLFEFRFLLWTFFNLSTPRVDRGVCGFQCSSCCVRLHSVMKALNRSVAVIGHHGIFVQPAFLGIAIRLLRQTAIIDVRSAVHAVASVFDRYSKAWCMLTERSITIFKQ